MVIYNENMNDDKGANPTPNRNDLMDYKEILEMPDEELEQARREITKQTYAWLRDHLTPCDHPWADRKGEPHGMHSDDGWDYLNGALNLATEVHDIETPEEFKTWLKNKADLEHPDCIATGYACDGIPPLYYEIFQEVFEADEKRFQAEWEAQQ